MSTVRDQRRTAKAQPLFKRPTDETPEVAKAVNADHLYVEFGEGDFRESRSMDMLETGGGRHLFAE